MNDTPRLLIVEDELKLAQLAADYLHNAGFDSQILTAGDLVLPWLRQQHADLILLDLMLPRVDGLTLCREIRSFSQVPIIMVTARVEEIDRLLGLELGADDYICKPYSPREMVARVKAVLRRLPHPDAPVAPPLSATLLRLNADRLSVAAAAKEIELTAVEFQLLQTLQRRPGHIFSRAVLMELIYQDQRIVSDRTIDSHIKKLRKKLQDLLPGQELIHSVYGAGYRFDPPEAD
ncbi:response regulator [Methylomonas rhizoryzae]|uniref:response regulator n=1 Tax=Methylomonas rhizoryzae TaxID=2608981 RepID=UPI0012324D91|nr:response regulator [Methylomonas rhizoryzae]